ncbi:unnamed protein product [Saccharomyces cerevisiae]|nr:unnamed protein product [Saccharomyces cerevisiae]
MELKLPVTEPETVEPEEVDWGIELERLGAEEADEPETEEPDCVTEPDVLEADEPEAVPDCVIEPEAVEADEVD